MEQLQEVNPMDIPRVIFMGSGKIGLPTLHWLATTDIVNLVGIVTQQDKPVGRAQIVTPPPPKVLAKDRGIPVLQPEKIRRPEVLESIQQLAPDVIIVMAYGQILPKALLDLSTIACLNLHASLLPKHRGASPIQASILAGDTTTGITVMYMAEGLDTGDILSARALPVCRRETGESLHDRLALLGPEALTEALALLLVGKAPRIAQEGSLANYTPKLDRESGRLDWSASCYDLERRIRAMYSWPGAYTLVNVQGGGTPKKLKIHRAFPLHRFSGVPGEVLQINSRGIVVACGAGGLLLLTVQLEGKRRMSAIEFLRGFSLGPGVVLGG
jgi:methionyl-tRNA formyltransferase